MDGGEMPGKPHKKKQPPDVKMRRFSPAALVSNQRGAILLLLCLFALMILLACAGIYAMKQEQERKIQSRSHNQNFGVKCRLAIKKVSKALDEEMAETGEYPYDLSDEFMDKHKKLERYVHNHEIWSPQTDYELDLSTAFGTQYKLTGWCRDGYIYEYDSETGKISTDLYAIK